MNTPNPHRGLISGTVRYPSGQSAGGFGIYGELTAFPPPPHDPLAGGNPDILRRTRVDGSYKLDLPPATYTIKSHGTSPAGKDAWGEVAGIVVVAGSNLTVDVTVTEENS
jgi:hypothetical protein